MSHPADRNPKHLWPAFEQKLVKIVHDLNLYCIQHYPEYRAEVGETFRTTARQQELYAQGRTTHGPIVTKLDGVHVLSGHQSALASDTWFTRAGKIVWEGVPDPIWQYYGHLIRAAGLVWGGDWDSDQQSSDEKFVDFPHCEWNRHDRGTYAQAHAWAKSEGLI